MKLRSVSSDIEAKLAELRRKVALARDQANRITVGVTFYPNSTLQLRNPEGLDRAATSNQFSLFFRTSQPDGFLAYLGNHVGTSKKLRRTLTDDFMALEVFNKRQSIWPHWSFIKYYLLLDGYCANVASSTGSQWIFDADDGSWFGAAINRQRQIRCRRHVVQSRRREDWQICALVCHRRVGGRRGASIYQGSRSARNILYFQLGSRIVETIHRWIP